ncbi:MAG: hypothetical protein U1C57_02445 [Candidatus Doudnabacteria bacterium]|nr:hypothetical protein [bacterium]MDZ4243941.1 hypothetical protein [Candidatus Doudnabacteria bacterium]
MRAVINFSLPAKTAAEIKKRINKWGFASTSEYIRFLLDLDQDLISTNDLLQMSARADREYKTHKLKKYDSLADLSG